jgi:hypothetical protein
VRADQQLLRLISAYLPLLVLSSPTHAHTNRSDHDEMESFVKSAKASSVVVLASSIPGTGGRCLEAETLALLQFCSWGGGAGDPRPGKSDGEDEAEGDDEAAAPGKDRDDGDERVEAEEDGEEGARLSNDVSAATRSSTLRLSGGLIAGFDFRRCCGCGGTCCCCCICICICCIICCCCKCCCCPTAGCCCCCCCCCC